MRIFKVLNNNVAVILNEDGQEKIVMGRGICFKKKAGDDLNPEAIDKTFFLSGTEAHSDQFQVLIRDIPRWSTLPSGRRSFHRRKPNWGKN